MTGARWTVAAAALALLAAGGARAQAPATGAPTDDVRRIHVIERRPFTEAGRWEASLFAPVQVNAKFTLHAGGALELAYHLRENLAVQVSAIWFPYAVQSSLTEELVTKVRQQPLAANALLLRAGALAGLELMPIYGKLNVFDGKILRFGILVNAGLGVAQTRLQLRPSTSSAGRSFGDTGTRLLAGLGLGFRVFLGERFTVRLEVRDLVTSASVQKVNGCTYDDARAIFAGGASTQVSAGCDARAFGDTDEELRGNAAVASDQMKEPSADVTNNLAAFTGISWLF